jgi:hypothetical protein
LRVHDLRADSPAPPVRHVSADAIAFHPTRNALYYIAAGRVLTAPLAEERSVPLPLRADGCERPLVFNRDGSRLAVRDRQSIRIFTLDGTELVALPFPNVTVYVGERDQEARPQVAFSPDDTQVAIGYGRALAVHHPVTGELRYSNGALEAEVTGIAFDPTGRWMFVGRLDGTLVAYRASTFAQDQSVVLRWSLGPIRALARCGDALLTACDEGVKIWPMPKLLEGL